MAVKKSNQKEKISALKLQLDFCKKVLDNVFYYEKQKAINN